MGDKVKTVTEGGGPSEPCRDFKSSLVQGQVCALDCLGGDTLREMPSVPRRHMAVDAKDVYDITAYQLSRYCCTLVLNVSVF